MIESATLKDVAKEAGVGVTTVSRFLNNDATLKISSSTKEKIELAVKNLNYRPNAMARSLKSGKTFTFGLVIPDFNNPVYSKIITGVEQALIEQGYDLLVTSDKRAEKKSSYLNLVSEGKVDGLLIASSKLNDEEIEKLNGTNIPYVFINRLGKDAKNYVIANDEMGAYKAVSYLLDNNHEQIIHLTGDIDTDTSTRRLQGYKKALTDRQLQVNDKLIIQTEYTEKSGYEEMAEVLQKGELDFTAVFAANVRVAFGAMAALRDFGLRVPEDVSIIGFHDITLCTITAPPLTTIKIPLYEMGMKAGDVLIDLIQNHSEEHKIVIEESELIIRNSVKKLEK
ncbi:LacI family DNA-binding transcriptional regulator [Sporosarcina sp. 179-K 3D1 HS]|uniref:LacI family DNA-binding transcriptional regulator n=1 Tax=Sporosarcina sp. 179-K 3D1 HS TaxID=3232169 RepID=UPI00399FEB47